MMFCNLSPSCGVFHGTYLMYQKQVRGVCETNSCPDGMKSMIVKHDGENDDSIKVCSLLKGIPRLRFDLNFLIPQESIIKQ
jgi:hypothetical protein